MQELLTTPTVRILFLGSLLAATLLTPLVIRLARRLGAVDMGGYRKVHAQPTPLMGGLALVAPFVVVCGLAILDLARKELGLRFLQVWLEDGTLLLATSGTPSPIGKDFGTLDQVERLRVKTSEGDVVLIRFEISTDGGRRELQDVTACLAGIFDEFRVPESTGAQVVAIPPLARSG
jgi:hypothetical protein